MRPRARRHGPLACVIAGRDIVRALGLGGIRSAILRRARSPIRYSRFVETVIEWPEPHGDADVLVEALVQFGAAQQQPPVLYYGHDWDLLLVSRYREQLGSCFRFVVADATLVEDLVDKARFQTLVEAHDLPVPPGTRISPGAVGAPPPDLDLRFPVVLKPLTRLGESWARISNGKALRVGSREALEGLWPAIVSTGIEVLAQEEVPGPETRVESYHVYVDEHGEVVGEFTGRKIRTHPREFGYSTALEITDAADVAEIGRELSRRLGLCGVAKYDFKRDVNGELRLLEVNPRFNLWHHLGAEAGVNIPALVYDDVVGRSRRPAGRARPGTRWCSPRDYVTARAEGISLLRWIPWALSCEAKSSIAWDDPAPFVVSGVRMLARGPAGALRSLRHALRRSR